MKTTMGARGWSTSSLSLSICSTLGIGGGSTFFSSLWTPPPFSRRSFSNFQPCFSQILVMTSTSTFCFWSAKIFIAIKSPIIWNGLRFIATARSLTLIGSFTCRSFSPASLTLLVAGAAGWMAGSGVGTEAGTGGAGGATGGGGVGALIREMVGRTGVPMEARRRTGRAAFFVSPASSMSETAAFLTGFSTTGATGSFLDSGLTAFFSSALGAEPGLRPVIGLISDFLAGLSLSVLALLLVGMKFR
jgi:hypothetical protein